MSINDDTFSKWLEEGYPRPQLCRNRWSSLNGTWDFQEDPDDLGLDQNWYAPNQTNIFKHSIRVPFPPGSDLSEYAWQNPGKDAEVVWYRRVLTEDQLGPLHEGNLWALNFEAVDYQCDVWANGQHVGSHRGGYTPFTVTLPDTLPVEIVIRAKDGRKTNQPRGKQAWRSELNGIWYERSTGIWRDVWVEQKPKLSIEELHWRADLDNACLIGEITLSKPPVVNTRLTIHATKEDLLIAEITLAPSSEHVEVTIPLPALRNNMDWPEWLWSPQHPHLIDLRLSLQSEDAVDEVTSYAGIRTVGVSNEYLHINGEPIYIRGVLDQGYWPESFFTAPSTDAIKEEIELILKLGFNLSRIHERTPDRRYLAWADRLGLLLWAEFPSSYAFDDFSVVNTTTEWLNIVRRDRSSPSIVTWVPFNESWGISRIATSPKQRSFVEGVVQLTRALDESRPVSVNDGWEQPATDIVTTHDYADRPEQLLSTYESKESVLRSLNGVGPQGRRTVLDSNWNFDKPVIVSEFGGIALADGSTEKWGYRTVYSRQEYEELFKGLVFALLESPYISGFCYTQLTDTAQEANGICTADREPKLPIETIRAVISSSRQHDSQVRPRFVAEDAMEVGESL
ncbi:MAG: glycoside hydrolase family 2 TIM barrel-domain containing protein [Actinomycetaceae bacterium]|nr:glycoside hydrolase family 2 TIM barrel-domain containing protein [Actinomycetaceae bacterium]